MRWLILGIALVFSPLPAVAAEREIKPIECNEIEARAFGFVKCFYWPESRQWRLTYFPTAYKQVVKSGQYDAMLHTLCDAYGDSIHETIYKIFSRRTRETSCDRLKNQ